MANNFSTIKNNQSSEKFYLCRIVPRRVINDSLASLGGGQYSMTFPYFIQKVEANGVALSKVTTVSSPGEYSFDEDTKTLTVYSTPSASNIIIVFYYVFYTGGRHRVVRENPESTTDPLRDWLPRIITNPRLSQSIEDLIEGNLRVSLSSLSLINTDYDFQNYLSETDSFNDAEIKLWLCLDDTENIQKIFDGKVAGVGIDKSRVNISFRDPLSILLEPAFLGDDSSEVYFNIIDFPNMLPIDSGEPIRFIFGKASRYQSIPDSSVSGIAAEKLDWESLNRAVCTTYSSTITTSNNREWGICRTADGFIDFGFTPSAVDQTNPNFTRFDGTVGEVSNFYIGDSFVYNSLYFRVLLVDRTNGYLYCTKDGTAVVGSSILGNDCPAIVISDSIGGIYYALYGRDYTATTSATSGGNTYLKIDFVNNFETNHAGLTALDPGIHQVFYRVRPDITNAAHGSVVKMILESSGGSVNSASVVSANAAFSSNCSFSIPQFDEPDYSENIKYLQLIFESALSYITLNNDFDFEYHLFTAPSSATEISDIDIINGTFKIEIEYQDIINQLIAYNAHWSSSEAIENASNSPSATEENLSSKYLHNINRVKRFRHVLDSITDRLPDIMAIRSNRRAKYLFDTKAINVDSILGEDLLLSTGGILGGDSTKQLKIISLTKSPKETKIIASDLFDL